MKNLALILIVAALTGMSIPAQAIIVVAIPTNTVTFTGIYNFAPDPAYQLSITYDVTEDNNTGLYTYNYDLVTTPAELLSSFSIGGAPDPIDTFSMIQSYGLAESSPASAVLNNSVVWEWAAGNDIPSDDVSFTSTIAPGYATFTVSDDDIDWTSPMSIPAPIASVPEPSSFGLLAVAAFAFGVVRYRKAASMASAKRTAA